MKRNMLQSGRNYGMKMLGATAVILSLCLTACGNQADPSTKDLKNPITSGEEQKSTGADQNVTDQNQTENTQGITGDEALTIALEHADLKKQDMKYNTVKEELEDGRKVFEIEFKSLDGVEYEYELSAEDGLILKFSYDNEDAFRKSPSADDKVIPEDQAVQTVLDCVPGAKVEDVSIYLERDDGRQEYDADLFYENIQYEFKIDAYSGKVMEWEGERK
ncbi:MAG: hypothetical protein HFI37_01115 [Lachnospiraceae bacterium]|nr:hypothetical protein [Lachnospiraceae bacterium]